MQLPRLEADNLKGNFCQPRLHREELAALLSLLFRRTLTVSQNAAHVAGQITKSDLIPFRRCRPEWRNSGMYTGSPSFRSPTCARKVRTVRVLEQLPSLYTVSASTLSTPTELFATDGSVGCFWYKMPSSCALNMPIENVDSLKNPSP